MPIRDPHSFVRYLAAKKSVDDRALNRHVWEMLSAQMPGPSAPLRVLEVGAGIGTMLARTVEWGLFSGDVLYLAVDSHPDNAAEVLPYLRGWAEGHGAVLGVDEGGQMLIQNSGPEIRAEFHIADAFGYIREALEPASIDLLIANAFIDLVHIPTALPLLFSALKPGGLFYFSITFDGVTAFEPPIEPELDGLIERLYHDDMEKRRWNGHPTGGSEAGRRLLRYLLEAGVDLLAAGASDWVVTPYEGRYPADEAAFLHHIIHTVATALTGHPELPAAEFETWIKRRHEQIRRGELAYLAHQIDVLGRVKGESE